MEFALYLYIYSFFLSDYLFKVLSFVWVEKNENIFPPVDVKNT